MNLIFQNEAIVAEFKIVKSELLFPPVFFLNIGSNMGGLGHLSLFKTNIENISWQT